MHNCNYTAHASHSLASLVTVDPESLPMGTQPGYRFRYVDIASVANGRFILPDEEIEYRDAPSRARRIIRQGDVLMSTVRPNLKAFAYCQLPPGNYVASTGFAVLRAKEDVDPRFILYSLLSDDVSRQIEKYVVGSNYPAITSADVKRLLVPALSPEAQKRVGQVLYTVDEAIAQTEALIAKTQQIKAGLMHDLFTRGVGKDGQLRPPREEAPVLYKESPLGWIPREWMTSTVGECLSGIDAGRSPECPDTPAQGDQWGVLKVGAVTPDGFREEENKTVLDPKLHDSSLLVRSGDLLLSRANTVDLVGLVCHVDAAPRNLMLSDKTLRLRTKSSQVQERFLFWSMQLGATRRQIVNAASGTSGSMKNISQQGIRALRVGLPDLEEQVRIAARMDAGATACKASIQELIKVRQLKTGLMSDLLTGRVRVPAADAQLVAPNV